MFDNIELDATAKGVLSRLNGTDPDNLIVTADYDLTLAPKDDPDDFHRTALKPHYHEGLTRLAPAINHFYVITARGGESALAYLKEHEPLHGPIQNLSLASNSGHWLLEHIASPAAKPVEIPVPGYTDGAFREVRHGMQTIVHGLHAAYGHITKDLRELCDAVIYEFSGNRDSDHHRGFLAFADELKDKLGPSIAPFIKFEGKAVEEERDGQVRTRGYIDLKPVGMDKGYTTEQILGPKVHADTVIIAAGDSGSDYPMMRAAAKLVASRRQFIGISVGPDLANNDPDGLIDVAFKPNGHSPIDVFHAFLGEVTHIAKAYKASVFDATARLAPSAVQGGQRAVFASAYALGGGK